MKAKSLVAINKRKETQRKDAPARACNHNLERKKHAQAAFQTQLGGRGDPQKLSRGRPNRRRSCMETGQEKKGQGSHVCTMEFQRKVGRSHNSSSRSKKDKLPRPITKEICLSGSMVMELKVEKSTRQRRSSTSTFKTRGVS